MRPDAEADEGDGRGGGRHELVAEQHLAGEDRDDLGDHAEDRQDQDVHLRVAEEPEEVLPQERRAAVLHVEEVRPQVAVEQDHRQAGRQRRDGEDDQHRGPEHRPDEEGDLAQGHAGARMARMVAMKLTAAARVPTPLTIRPRAQKSVAAERAKVRSVSGA